MIIRLSYDLSESCPYPAGLPQPNIEQISDMHRGDISNVYKVTFCNHVGTHIDGPNHFGKGKPPLSSFDVGQFIFQRPLVIDVPKSDGEVVIPEDLAAHREAIADSDVLLMRTGFSGVRVSDPVRYQSASAGFSSAAAQYVVDEFPKLRALAMDTLSFACPLQLDDGIRAHQILLDENDRDVFLIEDLNLDVDLSRLSELIVAPLFCEHLDSAPCTILARLCFKT